MFSLIILSPSAESCTRLAVSLIPFPTEDAAKAAYKLAEVSGTFYAQLRTHEAVQGKCRAMPIATHRSAEYATMPFTGKRHVLAAIEDAKIAASGQAAAHFAGLFAPSAEPIAWY